MNLSTIDPLVAEGMRAKDKLAERLYERILAGDDIFYPGVVEIWKDLVPHLAQMKGEALFFQKNKEKKYNVGVHLPNNQGGFEIRYKFEEVASEAEMKSIINTEGNRF